MTTPDELARPVHPRPLPVIVRPNDDATWLEGWPGAASALPEPLQTAGIRIACSGDGETAAPVGADAASATSP